MPALSGDERFALAYAMAEIEARKERDPLHQFQPFAKQQAFIDSVLETLYYENWLVGANRMGKSDVGVYCDAQFARYGLEPRKPAISADAVVWDRATSGWVVGPDYSTLMQVLLPKLLDWPGIEVPPGAPHGPFIPRWEIEYWKHDEQSGKLKNGSLIRCKSNEQQQIRFAAAGVDWVHFDEEPLYRNYVETTLRVEAGRRLRIYGTCTLLPPVGSTGGVTWLYDKIIRPYQHGNRSVGLFGGSIWDNPYLVPEEIARLEALYPEGSPEYRIRLAGEWLPGLGGQQCYMRYRAELHVKPQPEPVRNVPLAWFMDFNVNPLCHGVGQYLNGVFHVYKVWAHDDANLDRMIEAFRSAYPTHGAEVWIYGDATGEGRHVQTAQSNYHLIRQGMLDYPVQVRLCVPTINPHRKDRVNAVNQALQDADGVVSVEIDPSCEHLILDLEQVLADSEGGPKKVTNAKDPYFYRSHSCLAGDTLITTPEGDCPIATLVVGDRVLLPTGIRTITAVSSHVAPRTLRVLCSDGTSVQCTPEHKFLTEHGLVTADMLRYGMTILTGEHPICQRVVASYRTLNLVSTFVTSPMMASGSILGLRDAITVHVSEMQRDNSRFSTCIATSGPKLMVPSLQAIISTIKTAILGTIRWPISSACLASSIGQSMALPASGQRQAALPLSWTPTETRRRRGIAARQGAHGIGSMALLPGHTDKSTHWSVLSVGKFFGRRKPVARGIARVIAKLLRGVSQGWTTKNASVPSVTNPIRSINTRKTLPVVVDVEPSCGKVVYDLTVEQDHCYLANGLLVSNSDAAGYWICAVRPVRIPRHPQAKPRQQYATGAWSPLTRRYPDVPQYASGGWGQRKREG